MWVAAKWMVALAALCDRNASRSSRQEAALDRSMKRSISNAMIFTFGASAGQREGRPTYQKPGLWKSRPCRVLRSAQVRGPPPGGSLREARGAGSVIEQSPGGGNAGADP